MFTDPRASAPSHAERERDHLSGGAKAGSVLIKIWF